MNTKNNLITGQNTAEQDESNDVTTTVHVELQLKRKGGGFKDDLSMLEWISACLNCNTNHVEVNVAKVEKPIVVIDMDGGLINDVNASVPVRCIILDGDCEGSQNEPQIVNGREVIVSDHMTVEIDRQYVQSIETQVDALDEIESD